MKRTRKVSLVTYTEPTPEQLKSAIHWAYILHDKDITSIDENGEPTFKKPHYHIYLEFGNPRYISAIAKEFEMPDGAINIVHNTNATLAYLTHRTQKAIEDKKFMYDVSEVKKSDDLQYDFTQIIDSAQNVDWMKIFTQETLQDSLYLYKKEVEPINSLQQFKNFVQTYHAVKQIKKDEG